MTSPASTDPRAFADGMFAVVDRLDADRFAEYYAPDAVLRFGNAEPVHGREAITATYADFFATLDGLRHDPQHYVHQDGTHLMEAHRHLHAQGRLAGLRAGDVRLPPGARRAHRLLPDLRRPRAAVRLRRPPPLGRSPARARRRGR
jgi:ketosteroid isomerase-like protein